MKIKRHRLYRDDDRPYPFRRSPNQSGVIAPEFLVMHYTAGRSAASSLDWLTNPDARASAHLLIGRDGAITQMVNFNRKAWHAGISSWAGRTGVNGFSIGIELDNPGLLSRRGDRWYSFWGDPVDDADAVEAAHKHGGPVRGWHAYSGEQLEAAIEVGALLARHYGLKDVVGHDDISPGRKIDPGPAFPMASYRARVLGREDEAPEVFVTTVALNIRTGAGTRYDKLAASPLPPRTRLAVQAEDGAWRLVDVLDTVAGDMDVQGWVHGRYIAPVV